MRKLWTLPSLKSIDRKRYTYAAVATTFAGGALIGAGAGSNWFGLGGDDGDNETGRQETYSTTTRQAYPEADTARQNWGKTLTDWGQPGANYGANLPDYDAIYENAKRRINQYYWGGATGGGVIDKIKASAAQRGVQDSPATGVLTSRMAAQESGDLMNKSSEVDTAKANAIEQARNNWLTSLTNLTNIAPQSTTTKGTATTYAPATTAMDALTSIAGPAAELATSYYTGGTSDILKSLMNASNASGGITSLANPYGGSMGDPYNNANRFQASKYSYTPEFWE